MRRTFLVIVSLAALLMLSAVVVFKHGLKLDGEELSWLDSVYFVVTTMMTVGYGDINLKDASPGVKAFGIGLMLTSGALLAATFGLLTDFILRARLEQFFGRGRLRMKDHIVLCGLGHVGTRVLDQLRRLGESVVVIDKADDTRFVDDAQAQGVPVVVADMRLPSTLERANVREARSIILATGNDLVNLEVALQARELKPDIRVVMRIFDHNLAAKIRGGFGLETTFSTSALAAPAFAMAAVEPAVVGTFYVGDDLVLILQLTVEAGSALDGMTIDAIGKRGGVAVVGHERGGERSLHPPETLVLRAGDRVTVSAAPQECQRLKAMGARKA